MDKLKIKKDKEQGKKRSNKWPTVRKNFLKKNTKCAVCGGSKKLEAHHVHPFHLHPELELDEDNLLALCEGNKEVNCHLYIGHLGNFKSFNVDAVSDAKTWCQKIKNRP